MEPQLEVISFSITDSCNLSCRFCARNADARGSTLLEPAAIVRAVSETLSFATPRTFSVTGGEPLCHPQLFEILEGIHSLGVNIRMNSNGTLFTSENIKRLQKSGVYQVTLSVDSLDDDVNENLGRGRTYVKSLNAAISYLKDAGIGFFIKSTLNDENIDEAPQIMAFAYSEGAIGFAFGRTVPIGRSQSDFENYLLQRRNYENLCKECSKDCPEGFIFLIDDPLKHFWDARIVRLLNKPGIDMERLNGGCTAGIKMLYVLPDGDVLPCPALPVSAGNIHESSINDIWFESELLKNLRDRNNLKGICNPCKRRNICGGCRGAAYGMTGDLYASDPACLYNSERPQS